VWAFTGNAQCKNPLLIKKSVLEKRLLAGLQGKVLHPDVVRYTLKRFEDELTKLVNQKADSGLERRKASIQKQIDNCTEAIAGGQVLRSLTDKIAALERELACVEAKIAAGLPASVPVHVRDARRYVEQRLRVISVVLNGDPRVAREEIAKHIGKITLTAEGQHTYVATGTWDLLGRRRIAWCRGPGMHDTATS
jgi:hypothetical protein